MYIQYEIRLFTVCNLLKFAVQRHVRIQWGEGGGVQGVRTPPPEKNIGFLSNTGPDPLKNHKATKPAFNVVPSSARKRNTI